MVELIFDAPVLHVFDEVVDSVDVSMPQEKRSSREPDQYRAHHGAHCLRGATDTRSRTDRGAENGYPNASRYGRKREVFAERSAMYIAEMSQQVPQGRTQACTKEQVVDFTKCHNSPSKIEKRCSM